MRWSWPGTHRCTPFPKIHCRPRSREVPSSWCRAASNLAFILCIVSSIDLLSTMMRICSSIRSPSISCCVTSCLADALICACWYLLVVKPRIDVNTRCRASTLVYSCALCSAKHRASSAQNQMQTNNNHMMSCAESCYGAPASFLVQKPGRGPLAKQQKGPCHDMKFRSM